MADGQKLSDGEVIKLEQEMVQRYESIRGQLTRLQGTLDTMEANWRGIGASAFNSKQVEINERVKHIGGLLTWFLDNLNETRKIKNKNEDAVRSTMQGIDVQYGGSQSALNSY
ncbi:WXG100 family type VII secretion target [Streptomyces cellulosae]|uniref:WXG100 family type VII secretion target n=1 Tax=Streptomyces cellulosae TaxID=1968 RepID=UPI0004C99304|nr:WXG100 family type VII secretion target [Streptomyces cellulosae]